MNSVSTATLSPSPGEGGGIISAIEASNVTEVQRYFTNGGLATVSTFTERDTLLHVAVRQGASIDTIKIVAKYVPVDSRNKYGETALHVACSTVRQDAVHVARQLVRGGADVNALNRKGETPLHWACSHGAADVTEFLIRHGADVNRATTRERLTPLHVATINHHPQLVSLLLAAGADVKLTDSLERTAVILARFHGYSDVSALLGDVTAPADKTKQRSQSEYGTNHQPTNGRSARSSDVTNIQYGHPNNVTASKKSANSKTAGRDAAVSEHVNELQGDGSRFNEKPRRKKSSVVANATVQPTINGDRATLEASTGKKRWETIVPVSNSDVSLQQQQNKFDQQQQDDMQPKDKPKKSHKVKHKSTSDDTMSSSSQTTTDENFTTQQRTDKDKKRKKSSLQTQHTESSCSNASGNIPAGVTTQQTLPKVAKSTSSKRTSLQHNPQATPQNADNVLPPGQDHAHTSSLHTLTELDSVYLIFPQKTKKPTKKTKDEPNTVEHQHNSVHSPSETASNASVVTASDDATPTSVKKKKRISKAPLDSVTNGNHEDHADPPVQDTTQTVDGNSAPQPANITSTKPPTGVSKSRRKSAHVTKAAAAADINNVEPDAMLASTSADAVAGPTRKVNAKKTRSKSLALISPVPNSDVEDKSSMRRSKHDGDKHEKKKKRRKTIAGGDDVLQALSRSLMDEPTSSTQANMSRARSEVFNTGVEAVGDTDNLLLLPNTAKKRKSSKHVPSPQNDLNDTCSQLDKSNISNSVHHPSNGSTLPTKKSKSKANLNLTDIQQPAPSTTATTTASVKQRKSSASMKPTSTDDNLEMPSSSRNEVQTVSAPMSVKMSRDNDNEVLVKDIVQSLSQDDVIEQQQKVKARADDKRRIRRRSSVRQVVSSSDLDDASDIVSRTRPVRKKSSLRLKNKDDTSVTQVQPDSKQGDASVPVAKTITTSDCEVSFNSQQNVHNNLPHTNTNSKLDDKPSTDVTDSQPSGGLEQQPEDLQHFNVEIEVQDNASFTTHTEAENFDLLSWGDVTDLSHLISTRGVVSSTVDITHTHQSTTGNLDLLSTSIEEELLFQRPALLLGLREGARPAVPDRPPEYVLLTNDDNSDSGSDEGTFYMNVPTTKRTLKQTNDLSLPDASLQHSFDAEPSFEHIQQQQGNSLGSLSSSPVWPHHPPTASDKTPATIFYFNANFSQTPAAHIFRKSSPTSSNSSIQPSSPHEQYNSLPPPTYDNNLLITTRSSPDSDILLTLPRPPSADTLLQLQASIATDAFAMPQSSAENGNARNSPSGLTPSLPDTNNVLSQSFDQDTLISTLPAQVDTLIPTSTAQVDTLIPTATVQIDTVSPPLTQEDTLIPTSTVQEDNLLAIPPRPPSHSPPPPPPSSPSPSPATDTLTQSSPQPRLTSQSAADLATPETLSHSPKTTSSTTTTATTLAASHPPVNVVSTEQNSKRASESVISPAATVAKTTTSSSLLSSLPTLTSLSRSSLRSVYSRPSYTTSGLRSAFLSTPASSSSPPATSTPSLTHTSTVSATTSSNSSLFLSELPQALATTTASSLLTSTRTLSSVPESSIISKSATATNSSNSLSISEPLTSPQLSPVEKATTSLSDVSVLISAVVSEVDLIPPSEQIITSSSPTSLLQSDYLLPSAVQQQTAPTTRAAVSTSASASDMKSLPSTEGPQHNDISCGESLPPAPASLEQDVDNRTSSPPTGQQATHSDSVSSLPKTAPAVDDVHSATTMLTNAISEANKILADLQSTVALLQTQMQPISTLTVTGGAGQQMKGDNEDGVGMDVNRSSGSNRPVKVTARDADMDGQQGGRATSNTERQRGTGSALAAGLAAAAVAIVSISLAVVWLQ